MPKLSEHYLQVQEQEFELELSYQEWLRDNVTEPSEDELNEMEEEFSNSSTLSNRIITHKPLNNKHYYPNYTTGA